MVEKDVIYRGQERLRSLLPKVKAQIAKCGPDKVEAGTALFGAQAPWIREDNLRAVIVYPAPLGGWHCDVLLNSVPPGVADSFGTPVGYALKTRAEAEEHAEHLLRCALSVAAHSPPIKPPAFIFFGAEFTFPPQFIKGLLNILPPSFSEEYAIERIEDCISNFWPGAREVTEAMYAGLTQNQRIELVSTLLCATVAGVYRYPPKFDKPIASPE